MPRPDYLPPPNKATEERMVRWVDEAIYYQHPQRTRDISNYRRAELYDQGFQWLWRAMSGVDVAKPSQWVQMFWNPNDPARIPLPVNNEGWAARVNESSRLGRPNYKPVVRPKGDRPNLQKRERSKLTQYMIEHSLEKMRWDKKSQYIYYHMPLYGGAYLNSQWVMRWDDIEMVASLTAVKCPQCGYTLTSPIVPSNKVDPSWGNRLATPVTTPPSTPASPSNQLPPGVLPSSSDADSPSTSPIITPIGPGQGVRLNACPQCQIPLVPFSPSQQEANSSVDSLQQPLGNPQPRGDWDLSVASPYDVFVRNLGYDQKPGQITDWAYAHVEHMEYLDQRWPGVARTIEPENPAALTKWHPVAGAPDMLGGMVDRKSFMEHARVKERHRAPYIEYSNQPAVDGYGNWNKLNDNSGFYWRLNRGRSTIVVSTKVVFDGTYLMESVNNPGEYIPRVYLDYIPWEPRDGGRRLQGYSIWELMFDAQDNINQITSQRQAVRQRMAVPIYLIPRTMNLAVHSMQAGVPGLAANIDVDPAVPPDFPRVWNNTTIDNGAVDELKEARETIHRLPGHTATESGTTEPGVDAALAMDALKQSAGENREHRILAVKEALTRVISHGSRLQRAFYIQPRDCKYEDENGDVRWTTLKGTELEEDVEISVEPDMVDEDKRRLVIKDLLQQKVISAEESPSMRRKIARYFGEAVPAELFEDEDLQDAASQREWILFWEEGRVPQVDPSLDDHQAHFQAHGRAAHEEKFRDLEDAAQWDDALKILDAGGGWYANSSALVMAPGLSMQDRVYNMWVQQLTMAGFPGIVQPPMAPPPVDPMTGQPQLDPATGAPVPPQPMAPPKPSPDLDKVLLWRAHMEGHRLEEEAKQFRAQQQPTLAAPGGAQTPAGTQVTPGQPENQPPGQAPYPVLPGPQAGGVNGIPGAANPQEASQMMGQIGGVLGPMAKAQGGPPV